MIRFSTIFTDWMEQISRFERTAIWLFLLVFGVFYSLTMASNFSETDDVFAFAYRTENFIFSHISDPRLMLYHMLNRGLYLSANGLLSPFDLNVSSIVTMRILSVVCAALSLLLMFRIMLLNFKLSPQTSLMGTLLLAFSYGFWRYAAEAEVYIPAIMLCLIIFHLLATENTISASKSAGLGFGAGLTILFYQPAVIPLMFAFPFLLLSKDGWPKMLLYCVTGSVTVLLGYLWGYWLYWPQPVDITQFVAFLSQRSEEFMVPSLSVKTVIVSMAQSVFSIGHDFTSANWVFAWTPIANYVQTLFPNNVLIEEIFLAKQVGALKYPLLILQALLVAVLLWIVAKAVPLLTQLRLPRSGWVILIWVLINGAIIGRLNPAGLEAWIMVFPGLILLASFFIIEPLIRTHRSVLVVLVALLLCQNALGGMYLVSDAESDYHQVKGRWVIENSSPDDLLIVAGDASLTEAMRYLANAKVVNVALFDRTMIALGVLSKDLGRITINTRGRDFDQTLLANVIADTVNNGGRVFVFGDFFSEKNNASNPLLHKLKQQSHQVSDSSRTANTFVLMVSK